MATHSPRGPGARGTSGRAVVWDRIGRRPRHCTANRCPRGRKGGTSRRAVVWIMRVVGQGRARRPVPRVARRGARRSVRVRPDRLSRSAAACSPPGSKEGRRVDPAVVRGRPHRRRRTARRPAAMPPDVPGRPCIGAVQWASMRRTWEARAVARSTRRCRRGAMPLAGPRRERRAGTRVGAASGLGPGRRGPRRDARSGVLPSGRAHAVRPAAGAGCGAAGTGLVTAVGPGGGALRCDAALGPRRAPPPAMGRCEDRSDRPPAARTGAAPGAWPKGAPRRACRAPS